MTTVPEKNKSKEKNAVSSMVLSAGLFIGMGLGFLLDNLLPWMFIGIGVGFVAMIVARAVMDKED